MPELIPAILTNDISDFRKKYAELFALSSYFTKLHVDFIDGEFLPNPTIQPIDLDSFKSPLILMAHFMAFKPADYFIQIKKIGFQWGLIQYEAFYSQDSVLESIEQGKQLGLQMGISVNPETSLDDISKILPKVSLVQVMGVHPGSQGREFVKGTLEKIKELKKKSRTVIISIDGGIKPGLALECAAAGADWIVIGSAILNSKHPKEMLDQFKREMESGS